eukprot:1205974-Pleurochrysis_carterae.AAC.2
MNGSTSATRNDRDSNLVNVAADADDAVSGNDCGRALSSPRSSECGPQVELQEAQAQSCAPAGASLPSIMPVSSTISCSSSGSYSGSSHPPHSCALCSTLLAVPNFSSFSLHIPWLIPDHFTTRNSLLPALSHEFSL